MNFDQSGQIKPPLKIIVSQVKKIPDGYHSITSCLIVKGGLRAIEYYKKVFGAKERGAMMTPDGNSVAR